MVTVNKKERERIVGENIYELVEFSGTSSDTKPTENGERIVDNGSVFIEVDTGKIFLYDLENEEWKEV